MSSYIVLARKYRPQSLNDLAGQDAIAQTLKNAIVSERLSHAILLCGPRGVGKTSTARILAKAINCDSNKDGISCNQCATCKSITLGNNLDVIEIDGASNNGVDQIRDLRENTKFATAGSRFKIYIIDEVHMLSTAAFNALLKTLEEPPPHIKFIFATTEVHKVPETIRSRTQRFDFRLVQAKAMIKQLRYICDAEKITIDEAALNAITAGARGSVRDALTLLDQAIVFANGPISDEHVAAVTGALSFESVLQIATALIQKKSNIALDILDNILSQGLATDQVFSQLIDLYRALMIVPENPTSLENMFHYTPDQLKQLVPLCEQFSQESAIYALQVLNETRQQARHYPQTRIALEMAILRCARIDNIVALADLISGKVPLPTLPAAAIAPVIPAAITTAPAAAPEQAQATPAVVTPPTPPKTKVAPVPPKPVPAPKAATPPTPPTPAAPILPPTQAQKPVTTEPEKQVKPTESVKPDAAKITQKKANAWQIFAKVVIAQYPSFSGLLQKAKVDEEDSASTLHICFPRSQSFQVERFESKRDAINTALNESYGDGWQLHISIDANSALPTPPPVSSAPPTPPTPSEATPPTSNSLPPWEEAAVEENLPPSESKPSFQTASKTPPGPNPGNPDNTSSPSNSPRSTNRDYTSRPMPSPNAQSNRPASDFELANQDSDVQRLKELFDCQIINIEKLEH